MMHHLMHGVRDVIKFGVKQSDGNFLIGLGLSKDDIARLQDGKPLLLDLQGVDAGLWYSDASGQRAFLQPRSSQVVITAAESQADVGALLGVPMPTEQQP